MKRHLLIGSITGAITLAFTLLDQQIVRAQGTMTYLSNLGQASAGSLAVGSNSWVSATFMTGTNFSGYILNSVQLEMTDASKNPSGFTAYVYSAAPASGGLPAVWVPNSNLGAFSSSLDPTTAGIYTFTAVSNIMLSASTYYCIVLTAGTAVADGAYGWSYTVATNNNSSGGWFFPVEDFGVSTSTTGAQHIPPNWYPINGEYPQFAIDATVIPEPGVLGLLGLGGLAFLWHRRKAKGS